MPDMTIEQHLTAARNHIAALDHDSGNEAINRNFYAASRHLGMHSSLVAGYHRKSREESEGAAKLMAEVAEEISRHAEQHPHREDTSAGLNLGTSLHLLAMEAHSRAEQAHRELLHHFQEGTPEHQSAASRIVRHREEAERHGAEVQRIAGISIAAGDAASRASLTANTLQTAESHEAAAEAHQHAASLDYDPETAAEHLSKAKRHRAIAQAKRGQP